MNKEKIYVCHEVYSRPHYKALEYLAKEHNAKVIYCEPNLMWKLRHPGPGYVRLLHNLIILCSLIFSRGHKVVIGMAPYNPFLKKLLGLLKNHRLYYHSSYTCWDGSMSVWDGSPSDISLWKDFTNNKIEHFFAVSEKTKDEVVRNGFCAPEKISVVNHSFEKAINIQGITPPKYLLQEEFVYLLRENYSRERYRASA